MLKSRQVRSRHANKSHSNALSSYLCSLRVKNCYKFQGHGVQNNVRVAGQRLPSYGRWLDEPSSNHHKCFVKTRVEQIVVFTHEVLDEVGVVDVSQLLDFEGYCFNRFRPERTVYVDKHANRACTCPQLGSVATQASRRRCILGS